MPDDLSLHGVGAISPTSIPSIKPLGAAEQPGKSFGEILLEKIEQVNGLQQDADTAVAKLASGETDNVNDVLVAVQKADMAFKTLMQIRNKLFDAYQEINQLRI